MDLTRRTCCVIDNGLFVELAVTLSKSFGRVYYCNSWRAPFPRSNAMVVGGGVPGVQVIESWLPLLHEIDLFVFPDIYYGPEQVFLREELGKRVWGSGLAERLEYKRAMSKQWLKQMGLPVGPYSEIAGMAELRRHLQRHDNVYVKSDSRGDMETFHSKSYDLIEPRLDELQHFLGAKGADYSFIVEEPIEAEAEVGFDGFSVDGEFPGRSLFGVETKDAGYIGKVTKSLPKEVTFVNSRLAPLFKELKYRGFWSSEIRVDKDGVPYLIDPCCRMASPPGELYQYMIRNLADVIWAGADGEMVEPEWSGEWGAQIVLKSEWAEHGWQPMQFPAEYRDNVKIHYLHQRKENFYCVPQQIPIPEVGSVVATGKTPEDAINEAQHIAEQVMGYDLSFNVHALDVALEGMEKL